LRLTTADSSSLVIALLLEYGQSSISTTVSE
jgi:hypothetical protein